MDITIAILNFKELSPESSFQLIMEGFANEIVIHLSKFNGLSVISPESIAQIKDNRLPETLSRLGVNYTLMGSYRKAKSELRIGIQLVRLGDAKIIFATNYSAPIETIFDVLDNTITQIVNVIQQQIDYDLLSFSYKKENVQLAAYENYLLGMDNLKKGGLEHDIQARKYFNAALAIDPGYAKAYTGLSLSYFNEWSCQLWDRWEVAQSGAQKYALKALSIDEQDYMALAVAGRTFIFCEEYEKAEHFLRKSVRINPNDADNLIQVAFSLIFLGLAKEAEKLYQRACKLNPFHPDWYFAYGSNIYFEMGEFTKAIALGVKVNQEKVWVDFPAYMAAAYFHVDDFNKMEACWNTYLKVFSKNILKSPEIDEVKALEWQKNVNPYKGHSNLNPFWEYIAKKSGIRVTSIANQAHPEVACFVKNGDIWEVKFKGKAVFLKHAKGHQDICKLIQYAGEEVHCSVLTGGGIVGERGIEVLDQQAKQNYSKKIKELQFDIVEAEEMGYSDRIAGLQEEYEQILDHLSSSVGLAGKSRCTSTAVDKARSAVTLRIRSSIKKMEELHPALAKHLAASIRTGTFCSYRPETPIDWEF